MFLGTPHSGSAMAKWAERLAKFIGLVHEVNPKILEVLKEDSEVLERIQGSFYDMLGTREDMQLPKISIICFFEQLPLKIVGEVTSHSRNHNTLIDANNYRSFLNIQQFCPNTSLSAYMQIIWT
jgi:hypothetical protein